MTLPLIIDTDVALGVEHEGRPRDVDDAYAIVAALNAPDIDVLGITTVFGNAPLALADPIAREIVALKGRSVPVATGAAEPLSANRGETNDAVEFMADVLARQPAHIAAIGPLTNLGVLAQRYPEHLADAVSVVIVGGRSVGNRFFLHGKGPVNDFNVEQDIDAARALLEQGVPVTMAGFELTSQVSLGARDLERLRPSTVREHFLPRTRLWLDYWRRTFPGETGFHPWDSAAIDWLLHPERYVAETRGWRFGESPDGAETIWLETGQDLPDRTKTFLTGFTEGGARAFLNDIVDGVH
ncbi:MAG: nucleoside hydrolase [Gammaproteobacteria bacterium]|nr:nucleoside hydrolase [Gammaproteobacteria bacterium]